MINLVPGIGLGSGTTAASLVSGQCAWPSSDIGTGNMCLETSTERKELHVALQRQLHTPGTSKLLA